MELTLEKIRNTIEGVGYGIGNYVHEVQQDDNTQTVGINIKAKKLYYNKKFVDKYVKTESDLFCLVMHELMHPLLGHYVYDPNDISVGLGTDAIINNMIATIYRKESNEGSLFRKYYKNNKSPNIILSTNCNNIYYKNRSRYMKFGIEIEDGNIRTTSEIIRLLKLILPKSFSAKLIGTHVKVVSGSGDGDNVDAYIDGEIPTDLMRGLEKSIKERISGNAAGFSEFVNRVLVEASKRMYKLKDRLLFNYRVRNSINKFLDIVDVQETRLSPVPVAPSRKDLIMLCAGFYPLYFHNRIVDSDLIEKNNGVVIYVDVSGSVESFLPDILAVLKIFRGEINQLYMFSNKVVQTPIEDFVAGKIDTTYGTDFDCIAKNMLENNYDKAVIFTDGYASMHKENMDRLKKINAKTFTVIFDNGHMDNVLKNFGPVVDLKEIVEAL